MGPPRSLRLQQFLRYVTEHTIDRGRPLQEIKVATTVFDKDANFDLRLDPIVRIEAGRLRLRLLCDELSPVQAGQPARCVSNNEDPVARRF